MLEMAALTAAGIRCIQGREEKSQSSVLFKKRKITIIISPLNPGTTAAAAAGECHPSPTPPLLLPTPKLALCSQFHPSVSSSGPSDCLCLHWLKPLCSSGLNQTSSAAAIPPSLIYSSLFIASLLFCSQSLGQRVSCLPFVSVLLPVTPLTAFVNPQRLRWFLSLLQPAFPPFSFLLLSRMLDKVRE